MGPTESGERHADDGVPLARFADTILVVCPRCGGRASVVQRPGLPELRYATDLLVWSRRLVCAGCGRTDDWRAGRRGSGAVGVVLGGTEEPFFGRPLWLQVPCAGRVLWAYNDRHVTALEEYVAARLREHGAPYSSTRAMFPRLPAWVKSAAHRPAVLKGLAELHTLAGRSAPADRSAAAHAHGDRPRPYGSLHFVRGTD
ncbi:hypothetical protein [Streptomyces sp. VRA16 Mangrove soil]|uniref:hypothetical protein n=1 Tax=Streptomyces sp. VRA16 Mangrove soil TaxID=2817434 RepID=UPI001A9E251C|nr:hypothetical protein [Streptomyces sp. VRA16 Mangrove soil]MBO1332256.1 hypothetical protein [Streptomyces sp. VRA16 Mangrove soil]